MITNNFSRWQFNQKRILIRADLNLPTDNGHIINTHRFDALKPTIEYLLQCNSSITLITHFGRPKNREDELSTLQLMPLLMQCDNNIQFASDIATAQKIIKDQNPRILLLENVRFWPEEKNGDDAFAHSLATLGDFFMQEAFGSLHNNDSSICRLPYCFSADKRSVGPLVLKELAAFEPIKNSPKDGKILIICGSKVSSKIRYIKGLCDTFQTILLGPAFAFTFLKAQGINVGKSLVDETLFDECNAINEYARCVGTTLLLPSDFQIKINDELLNSIGIAIPDDAYGVSIGQQTEQLFNDIIKRQQIAVCNGIAGFIKNKETMTGMNAIFEGMTAIKDNKIVAGGDAVSAVQMLGYQKMMTHLSTGGGSVLCYLSGQTLNGLVPFLKNGTQI